MPLEYYFNGHLRWTLIWENPNYWAAFLACLLAWVWHGQRTMAQVFLPVPKSSQPHDRDGNVRAALMSAGIGTDKNIHAALFSNFSIIALHLVEIGIWFLLVKTYSRGGLVAASAGMVFFFGLHGLRNTGWKSVLRNPIFGIIIRIVLIAAICMAAGFAARISPAYVAQDKSVLNRTELWKGALVMMSDSPLRGWGAGQGGRAYANWYQSPDKTERPMSFVNSYFDIGVEQGSHILSLVLIIGVFLITYSILLRKHPWAVASGACLVAWMAGNLWSSMWNQWGLWILPAISILMLLITIIKFGKHRLRVTLFSLAGGLVAMFLLLLAGRFMSKDYYWKATPLRDTEVVTLNKRASNNTGSKTGEIWVDNAIFGPVFGKLLRSDFVDLPFSEWIVYSPWAQGGMNATPVPAISIYTGFQAGRIQTSTERHTTIILYPTVPPPETTGATGANLLVCLPKVDASSYDMPWRRWAAKTGTRLTYSTQSGRRIFPQNNSLFWSPMVSDE